MAEQLIQSKLTNMLREEKIQLWNPPFSTVNNEAEQKHMQKLAEKYSLVVGFPVSEVLGALESIRCQSIGRREDKKMYQETCVATIELLLPRDEEQDVKNKKKFKTKLDVTAEVLMEKIAEEYRLQDIKLILNGTTLKPEKKLDEQNVKNNSKMMVLKVSEPERKKLQAEEKQKKNEDHIFQRTTKGFQILSERDDSYDPETTPFLEIADQKGNPLQIPLNEKKALILAMGFHEKGRALLKRKEFEAALSHLIQADGQFEKCDSKLLTTVDNYAVLQLDIVWCYRALEALSYLDNCKQRLQKAEDCFLTCYGQQQKRLIQIKGNTGCEEVLFLRLYLLQSLLLYLEGNEVQASQKLRKVEDLYSRLSLNPEEMTRLMTMGFTEQEARLSLRACDGKTNEAVEHILKRRKEREETNQMEKVKRRRRVEAIRTLQELGFSKREAADALHRTGGDVNKAYTFLLESIMTNESNSSKISQADQNNEQENQGAVPPELLTPSLQSSPSEEPSTSDSAGSGSQVEDPMEVDLVNEVLEDIPRHEEDYLDITLEEEKVVIAQMKSYLKNYAHPL